MRLRGRLGRRARRCSSARPRVRAPSVRAAAPAPTATRASSRDHREVAADPVPRPGALQSSVCPSARGSFTPPPPVKPLADLDAAIDQALDAPLGSDPLDALLRPGDAPDHRLRRSIPCPCRRCASPTCAGQIIERVLERAYRAGVADIHLIAALALHRRMTPAELRHAVGPAVFDSFGSDELYNHDAEDPDGNVSARRDRARRGGDAQPPRRRVRPAGLRAPGHRRRCRGDRSRRPSGSAPIARSARTTPSHTLRHSRSFMDPDPLGAAPLLGPSGPGHRGRGADTSTSRPRSTTTCSASRCAFLGKPTQLWTPRDQVVFAGMKRGLDRMPIKARRTAFAPHVGALRGHLDHRWRRAGGPLSRPWSAWPSSRPCASRASPTWSPPGCPTSARTTSTRSSTRCS